MTPNRAVLRVLALRNEAQALFEAEFKRAYPPGSHVEWSRAGARAFGTVVEYVYREKLRVRRTATGAEYNISMHAVIEAMK